MKRWSFGISALPLLVTASTLAPGCADEANECAAGTCGGQGGEAGDGGAGAGQGPGGQGGAGAGQGGQGGDLPPASCIPWDNAPGVGIPETCGVFVASAGGSDGDGSQASPHGTIGAALDAAQPGTSIYLCNEIFEESVVVPSGVTVYGGLDCTSGWSYETGSQTTLVGLANTPAARFSEGNATTTLYDLELAAADATNPGASSIAALVEGGTVNFERVDVLAGDGADGATGDTPTTDIGPSDPNHPDIKGNAPRGTDICSGNVNRSAALPKANPKCTTSVGGAGGQGQIEEDNQDATAGSPGQVSGGSGGTPGGAVIGVCGASGCPCGVGGDGIGGASGQLGSHGGGATGIGFLTIEGWDGVPGFAANRGTHGAGGGGGAGAQNGGNSFCGRGGNSGGAGGCGGLGGLGGAYGGGSFAVVVLDGVFSTSAGSLSTGAGGTGGDGGVGQNGAVGGNGGTGGACAGGKGGDGGDGGQGGGGLGGHSIAIAHTPDATVDFGAGTMFTLGDVGLGGAGANLAGNGASGVAEQVFEIEAK